MKEGGGASESAVEWLQLNQNKERLIAKCEFFEKTGQKQIKDSEHLHQWHLPKQIFTMYYNYWYLLRVCIEKTTQMVTGKTAFPYQSYQWRLTVSLFHCCSAWQWSARCCMDTAEVTIPASECFPSLLCLTLVNSSFLFFLKGLIHCSLMSTEWLLLTSAGTALVHRWMVLKGIVRKDKWKDSDTGPVMFNYSSQNENDSSTFSIQN